MVIVCWNRYYTRELCCVEPSPNDCWLPEEGLTFEMCCKQGDHRVFDMQGKVLFRDRFLTATASTLDLLQHSGGCMKRFDPLTSMLESFYSAETSQQLQRFSASRASLHHHFEAACAQDGLLELTWLNVATLYLFFLPPREHRTQQFLRHFTNEATRWQASMRHKSSTAMTNAAVRARRKVLREEVHIAMVASVGSPPFGQQLCSR
eukprot:TRINITY_DN87125_c0_g1_i1.p1 TRINITY_DN87125_c0_g1~~TRINITY_DN87125_c0_g1_i1.p1  ORF type:complete len:206 (+),score=50.18 TRINITY_DN87125_c0_g1_i1:134-751(+)